MKRLLSLMLILLLSGCATLVSPTPAQVTPPSGAPTQAAPSPTTAPRPTSAPSPLTSPLDPPFAASPLVAPPVAVTPILDNPITDVAKDDLVTRLHINASQIQVLSFEEVEWPDASVGCPKPGVMYLQVITGGYKIVLTTQGKTYEYHSKATEPPFLCEKLK